jgi:LuxR family maltose regulon positive regulatory protein
VSLDAQRTWFRYHQLLTDFLRLELRRTAADEIPHLHRRAAGWFVDRGYVIEGIRHVLAAGDWHAAARLVADHSFRWVLNGEAGTIDAVLEAFPDVASADDPDLALAHAARDVNRGLLAEAGGQLAIAESYIEDAVPPRRRRLAVAAASLRLAMARRSGQFSEVIEQVNLLDASMSDQAHDELVPDGERRAVALLNLGIVETWSGQLADAERHLLEGAELAQTTGRPYLEVACRAHLGFPSASVSYVGARMRCLQAIALAEEHQLDTHPILAPAFGALAGVTIWMGEFSQGEQWLDRAWDVAAPHVDPAAAVLLHTVTGMLHAGRSKHQRALDEFAAASRKEARLTGLHALAPLSAGWLAAMQARVGLLDEARRSLEGFSAEDARMGPVHNAHAAISIAEGEPEAALNILRSVTDQKPLVAPAFVLVEAHLLAGIAQLHLGDRKGAATAAEAALAAAEPDRLLLPFAIVDASEVLEALPRHETAHAALLSDILDLLHGEHAAAGLLGRAPLSEALSPSELRVLRYLPTNLTRPDIARELYVSVNTINTHIRNIYIKLNAGDRSSAVRHARELRLLSTGRSAATVK